MGEPSVGAFGARNTCGGSERGDDLETLVGGRLSQHPGAWAAGDLESQCSTGGQACTMGPRCIKSRGPPWPNGPYCVVAAPPIAYVTTSRCSDAMLVRRFRCRGLVSLAPALLQRRSSDMHGCRAGAANGRWVVHDMGKPGVQQALACSTGPGQWQTDETLFAAYPVPE